MMVALIKLRLLFFKECFLEILNQKLFSSLNFKTLVLLISLDLGQVLFNTAKVYGPWFENSDLFVCDVASDVHIIVNLDHGLMDKLDASLEFIFLHSHVILGVWLLLPDLVFFQVLHILVLYLDLLTVLQNLSHLVSLHFVLRVQHQIVGQKCPNTVWFQREIIIIMVPM